MFNKKSRLVKKRDIDRVFRKGRRAAQDFVFVNSLANNLSYHRAVVIVGTKSGLKAVGRNLLKRRAREVLSSSWDQLSPSSDIIIGFRGRFERVPKQAIIKEHIEKCLVLLRPR